MTKPVNTGAAQALLDAANAEEAKRNNHLAVRNATLETARKYGAENAAGAMSLTKLAYLFNEAVRIGVMTEADAGLVYREFSLGHNEVVEARGSISINGVSYSAVADKLIELEEKSAKTPVSMFRSFGKMAAVAQGLALYQTMLRVRADIPTDKVYGSAYSCMVKVNREVVSAAEKSDLSDADILAGKQVVTEDQIRAWLTKAGTETGAAKSFADKLADLIETARKLHKKGEADLEPALVALKDAAAAYDAKLKGEPKLTVVPKAA
jgi:hypothetical protein